MDIGGKAISSQPVLRGFFLVGCALRTIFAAIVTFDGFYPAQINEIPCQYSVSRRVG